MTPTARTLALLRTLGYTAEVTERRLPRCFITRDFLGWVDIIEFDGLSNARGLEMWLPLWVRLMGPLGTAEFNLKIVR